MVADSVNLCWSVGALHALCVSARRHPQDGVLQVHPSRGQNVGSRAVLNRDCREGEGEEMQVADFCGQSHGKNFLGQWRNLVSGILGERCHSRFRAICADIKEVKTTNSKGLAKQEDELSLHPPYSPDLAPSDFHLFEHCFGRFPASPCVLVRTAYKWR